MGRKKHGRNKMSGDSHRKREQNNRTKVRADRRERKHKRELSDDNA